MTARIVHYPDVPTLYARMNALYRGILLEEGPVFAHSWLDISFGTRLGH